MQTYKRVPHLQMQVAPSYVLSFGYVGCDTVDKILKAQKAGDDTKRVAIKGMDCLLWQTLASVLIPGKVEKQCGVICCSLVVPSGCLKHALAIYCVCF